MKLKSHIMQIKYSLHNYLMKILDSRFHGNDTAFFGFLFSLNCVYFSKQNYFHHHCH